MEPYKQGEYHQYGDQEPGNYFNAQVHGSHDILSLPVRGHQVVITEIWARSHLGGLLIDCHREVVSGVTLGRDAVTKGAGLCAARHLGSELVNILVAFDERPLRARN